MRCPRCGAELDNSAYFCSECGNVLSRNTGGDNPIPSPDYSNQGGMQNGQGNAPYTQTDKRIKCTGCGALYSADSAFCPQCGRAAEPAVSGTARPRSGDKNTLYTVIIIIMAALVIGIISFIVTFVIYNSTTQKDDSIPTAPPSAVTAAPAAAATATPEPTPQSTYSFNSNVYRISLYSPSASYKRMDDIHRSTESSSERLNELADAIFDFDRCCEAYMNDGDGEVFKYLKQGSTAYDQQTNYKSKNPGLRQTYINVEVNDAREYGGYYYVWVQERLEVQNNGSVSDTNDRWVYKMSYGSDGWIINDYTRDPVFG